MDVNELLEKGRAFQQANDAQGTAALITESRTILSDSTSKSKSARLIRNLLDLFQAIPNSAQLQEKTLKENMAWADQESRSFLRQALDIRLATLYFTQNNFTGAQSIITELLVELKKLDDKLILTEVHLLESKIHDALKNSAKAQTALTSAKTNANAIYCPPVLLAQLDLQSGILRAQEKDYKTGFSYFFEAFEVFAPLPEEYATALKSAKYMLLCKIMLGQVADVIQLTTSKSHQKFKGKDMDALLALAQTHEKRDLKAFEDVLKEYKEQLGQDPMIRSHLAILHDTLMETNLLKIIEPYSKAEISFIALKLQQPVQSVEQKLSTMILDNKINGVLDQGIGCLFVFPPKQDTGMYEAALKTLDTTSAVVDALYAKAIAL